MRRVLTSAMMTVTLCGCATRIPSPPEGAIYTPPLGVVEFASAIERRRMNTDALIRSAATENEPAPMHSAGIVSSDPGVGARITVASGLVPAFNLSETASRGSSRSRSVLLLSGGGSRGAFGAGVLCGWTERGDRPRFDVITGISTGALQATFAFLGPDYDHLLRRFYTGVSTRDIYRPRPAPLSLLADSLNDTAPLARLIERTINDDVLDAVASAHAAGQRLYVGTSNLDTDKLVVWDMGVIASSDAPDRRSMYRDVLLASAAIPVFFPPVYIEMDVDGRTFSEMHVDGGAKAPLFFHRFMLDVSEAIGHASVNLGADDLTLYTLVNGKLEPESAVEPVQPGIFAIASASINSVYGGFARDHVYRTYAKAMNLGMKFRLAAIPPDVVAIESNVFEREGMELLFDLGFDLGRSGDAWVNEPPGLDADEVVERRRRLTMPPDRPKRPSIVNPLPVGFDMKDS